MLFFKRNPEPVQTEGFLACIGTDLHSHLLPAVDDGVQDTATSIHFMRQLQAWGIRQFITTPHIKSERYDNSPATLQPAYEQLQAAMREEGLNVPLHYAAEYYLDETIDQRLTQPLLTLKDKLVLVEVSMAFSQAPMYQWLFQLETAGYQPLLAHPERYMYMHENFSQYENIRSKGVQLQVNLLSLAGYYGKPIQKIAERLLDAKLVDYAGTDIHHHKHLAALEELGQRRKTVRMLENYGFKNQAL